MRALAWIAGLSWLLSLPAAGGAASDLPSPPAAAPRQQLVLAPIVGDLAVATVGADDTLLDVAVRNRIGFEQLERLNPDVDVWMPRVGTELELPTAAVLPAAPREGLVINIPEMRLYDFTSGPLPKLYAIAIGDLAVPTPEGDFRIRRKRTDPTWYVPESILRERPDQAPIVPPGPDNPLGDRWMTLGATSYGIHGTNVQWSIGRLATHGCIRLYNEDVRELYDRIPEGTPVHVVYQTAKLGVRDNVVYLEVHPDVYGKRTIDVEQLRVQLLVAGTLGELDADSLDPDQIASVFEQAAGVPVPIASTASEPR